MNIEKSKLRTLWYEDKDGNIIEWDKKSIDRPEGAEYQVSRFPLTITTMHLKLIRQSEVDKCKHPKKYRKKIVYCSNDGIVRRVCSLCFGEQARKKWRLWPKKWEGYGSRDIFSSETHIGNGKIVLAMANSGDSKYYQLIKDACHDNNDKIKAMALWACKRLRI
jgi:hypothetical protein